MPIHDYVLADGSWRVRWVCCGSGSRIWCFFDPLDPDPGSVFSGSRISISVSVKIKLNNSVFRNLWLQLPQFIFSPPLFVVGSRMKKKIRIRGKHPGSATLVVVAVWECTVHYLYCLHKLLRRAKTILSVHCSIPFAEYYYLFSKIAESGLDQW